jgi:hypothetical protein
MTNEDRRENRYQRRKIARQNKIISRASSVGSIEDVFTYSGMYKYGKKCCNGVRWKQSTQIFELHLFSITARNRKSVLANTYKWHRFYRFTLRERGKIRQIDAPCIQDRQIHKVLATEILFPLYKPFILYNNGASQKNKGLEFTYRQLKNDLHEYFRKYGNTGYVVLLDFKKFFPSASHNVLKQFHTNILPNSPIRELADSIVNNFYNTIGLPLGVEPSQTEMIHLPSILDADMTCSLRLKYFAHYMDDYYILVPDTDRVNEVISRFRQCANKLKLTISENKLRVITLSKPFKFCKVTFRLTDTGKVIANGNRDSAKRARRKLKSFVSKPAHREYMWDCIQSSIGYFKKYNDHKRILNLNRLVYTLFGVSVQNFMMENV